MKIAIIVVNKGSESVRVGIDGGVDLKSGKHEYKLKQSTVDAVVKAASVLDELEVQLIPQEEIANPSTVDGKAKLAEMSAKNTELEKLLADKNAELEKAQGELAAALEELEKSKAATAGGDKNEGVTETKKTTGKRTNTKTENKE